MWTSKKCFTSRPAHAGNRRTSERSRSRSRTMKGRGCVPAPITWTMFGWSMRVSNSHSTSNSCTAMVLLTLSACSILMITGWFCHVAEKMWLLLPSVKNAMLVNSCRSTWRLMSRRISRLLILKLKVPRECWLPSRTLSSKSRTSTGCCLALNVCVNWGFISTVLLSSTSMSGLSSCVRMAGDDVR